MQILFRYSQQSFYKQTALQKFCVYVGHKMKRLMLETVAFDKML